jgi:hypothetical protein
MQATQQQPIAMMPAMNLAPEDWNSLYLKVLPVDLNFNGNAINNEETLSQLIECGLGLGKVSRIDFTERKNVNGHVQRSAYIHFYLWNATSGAHCRNIIDEQGSITYSGLADAYGTVSPFMGKWYNGVTNKRFLKFKKNINPVSSTNVEDMNREQLMNNYNKLVEHQKKMDIRMADFIKTEREQLIAIADEWREKCNATIYNDNKMSLSELEPDEEVDNINNNRKKSRFAPISSE